MNEPRTVRKDSNRTLYFSPQRRYLQLDNIRYWVTNGTEFDIIDNSGIDVTSSVLLQVLIAHAETSSPPLSTGFLLAAIRCHAEMKGALGVTFVEQSLRLLPSLQSGRKARSGTKPEDNATTARALAETHYKCWQSVEKQIRQALADAAVRESTEGALDGNPLIPIPARRLNRPSRRSPRPAGVTARRE